MLSFTVRSPSLGLSNPNADGADFAATRLLPLSPPLLLMLPLPLLLLLFLLLSLSLPLLLLLVVELRVVLWFPHFALRKS